MSDRPGDRRESPGRPPGPLLFGRPVQWTVGFLSGLLRSALMRPAERRQRALERWTDDWFAQVRGQVRRGESAHEPREEAGNRHSVASLRRLLLGRSRGYVVSVLGSPPASSAPSSGKVQPPPPGQKWTAEVWYYPLSRRRRQGLAITFKNDIVCAVDRLSGPR